MPVIRSPVLNEGHSGHKWKGRRGGGVNPRALWEWWRSVRRKIDRKETQKNTSSAWGAFVAHAHVSLSLFSATSLSLSLTFSPTPFFVPECVCPCVRESFSTIGTRNVPLSRNIIFGQVCFLPSCSSSLEEMRHQFQWTKTELVLLR